MGGIVLLNELSISDFAAKLASAEPAPGGGSAAALCGLMGTSLLEMTINLSLGRPEFARESDVLAEKQKELARVHIELQLLIDRDAQAFRGVMAAYQMPKQTEESKKLRLQAIQDAFRQAAEIPLETARVTLESLEIARFLCGRVNPHVVSDLAVGALACHSGLVGALLNTAINLPSLKDETLVKGLYGQVHLLRTAADDLLADIRQKVYADDMFAVMRSSCG